MDNPNTAARKELEHLPISGRHAYNLETVVLADLHRKEKVKPEEKGWIPRMRLP